MRTQPPADIVLKGDRTRFVRPVDLYDSKGLTNQRIRLDPGTSTISLSRIGGRGAFVTVRDMDGNPGVLTGSRPDYGRLSLREGGSATSRVSLLGPDDGGHLVVRNADGDRTTEVTTERAQNGGFLVGGRMTLFRAGETEAVRAGVERAGEEGGAGVLTVHDANGRLTARLRGTTASLELFGRGESGDLVVQDPNEGRSQEERDISIHATAAEASDFGVANGNRPLIFLNGPAARLELGRQERRRVDREEFAQLGDGADGRIRWYPTTDLSPASTPPQTVLEAGVGSPAGLPRRAERFGELVFKRGQRVGDGGHLRTGHEGLFVVDASGTATLQVTIDGTVATRGALQQRALPLVGPRFASNVVRVKQSRVADIGVFVGDGSDIVFQIVDPLVNYGYEGRLRLLSEQPLSLRFDTGEAGQSRTSSVTVEGDARLTGFNETRLSGSLAVGRYGLVVRGPNGRDVATLVVLP